MISLVFSLCVLARPCVSGSSLFYFVGLGDTLPAVYHFLFYFVNRFMG